MGVGVQAKGTIADGWTQNGNGLMTPRSANDWPNENYWHGRPYITVWLKQGQIVNHENKKNENIALLI
jgi:hypothetical protein